MAVAIGRFYPICYRLSLEFEFLFEIFIEMIPTLRCEVVIPLPII